MKLIPKELQSGSIYLSRNKVIAILKLKTFAGFYQSMALALWPYGPMPLWSNGTVVLSSRACLSRIPEYEFDRVFDKDSYKYFLKKTQIQKLGIPLEMI